MKCPNLSMAVFGTALFFALVTPNAGMPRTMDGTLNSTALPDAPLGVAIATALSALDSNGADFVCTGASSIREEYGGGWRMWFRSEKSNARVVHVSPCGEILQNNETVPRGWLLKTPPSLSVQAAISNVTARFHGMEGVLSAAWIEAGDVWQVTALTSNGKTVFEVDSRQEVRPMDEKGTDP